MAQFKTFAPDVEVNGQTILAFVHALPAYRAQMEEVLSNHNLNDIQADKWYPQDAWLAAFQEIGATYGPSTLFTIGKAIPENAKFPEEINSLEAALRSIDMAYHMNHRGGEIGYYKLTHFDELERTATMECKNPYPSHFDLGILTTMLRKFRPEFSFTSEVKLDANRPTRLNGADSCFYRFSW